jgi:hypothetical protein
MTTSTTHTSIPTPAIAEDVAPTTHTEAVTNIIDVQAMPTTTKEEVAAAWLAAKQIESAGETAKSIRSALGERLHNELLQVRHPQRCIARFAQLGNRARQGSLQQDAVGRQGAGRGQGAGQGHVHQLQADTRLDQ